MRKKKVVLMRIFAGFMVMIMLFTGSSFTVLAEGLSTIVEDSVETPESVDEIDVSEVTEEENTEEMEAVTEKVAEEVEEENVGGDGDYSYQASDNSLFEYSLNDANEATITSYNGNVSALNIPDTLDGYKVVGIGKNVFQKNTELRMVVIPDSVTEIGSYAFSKCSNLENVSLSDNIQSIGTYAFASCAINTIHIPKEIKSCGRGVFSGCNNLKNITFEENITSIPEYLFSECDGLESIVIPDTVTIIGQKCFQNCTSLKEIKFGKNLQTIDNYAFSGCVSLETLYFTDSILSIKYYAFSNCDKLKVVELPKYLYEIQRYAFGGCDSIEKVWIPKTIKLVDTNGGPFYSCDNLKIVEFEQGITDIPEYMFSSCTGLERITIPDTVTAIGKNAFSGCKNLSEVTFNKALKTIDNYAFSGCTLLEEVVLPDTVELIKMYAFSGCVSLKNVRLSMNLKEIQHFAFGNCTSLCEIFIPKSITKTSDYDGVFENCTMLKKVQFEEGTTVIHRSMFASCTGLEEIIIPSTVERIEYMAFEGCVNLKKVTLGESLVEIGMYAFSNCTLLEEIIIPDGVSLINSYAFSGCSLLKKVSLPESITAINNTVFSGCTSLSEIKIPAGVKSIGQYAFRNCDALTSVSLPDGLMTIDAYAFYDCDALTSITIPDKVASLGNYVFAECDSLTNVKLGTGIVTIPTYAFNNCAVLDNVVIPYRVTEIKGYGFANCPKLKTITIPRSVTSIASTAFSYPTTMTVYGVAGTYAETWAKEKGATFVNKEVKATAVTLSATELKLARGASETLILTVIPADFTDEVTWKSTDTDVVTVASDGTVTAEGIGTATIKVFVGDVSQTCVVEVVQPVTSIGIYPSYFSMDAGEECPLNVEVYPYDAANKEVTWSSSDETIATVDQNGVVTSLAKGSATITATALDGSGVYDTCEITVTNNLVICNAWTALESEHNYSNNFSDAWRYTQEGAMSLSVTFDDRTNIEEGFDFLYIYDGSGNQVGKYTGTELAGKTVTIPGDTIRIKLVSDGAGNAWGFKVTNVTDREYFTITLDNGGEVENTTILAANGYPMPQIEPPVKLGKEFKGYFTEKDGKGDMYINADGSSARNSTFTEATTLYAYWVPAVYKVSLDANGGTCDIESIQVSYNQTYGTLPTPVWEGHAFLGWFTEKEGGVQVTAESVYTLTTNQTLYAHWETYVTVKFDANGGTVNGEAEIVITIKKGDRVSGEYIAEKQNSVFVGWYDEAGKLFDFSQPITSNIILYAHWEYKYTVENPYADVTTEQPVPAGTKVGLFTNTPDAQIYYTVDGSDPVTKGNLYVDVITISKDTTIKMYAKKDGFNPSAVVVLNYTVEKITETWGDIIPEDQAIWGSPANVPDKLWIAGYSDVVYSGTSVKFDLRVYDGKTSLVEKTDYTVAYKNNKLAAKATDAKAPTITVTGKGNYTGKLVQTFTIHPIDISVNTFDNKFEADDIYVAENGKVQKPTPVLYNNGKKMKVKKDFVVSYPSTGNGAYSAAGTYDVVLTGSGNYCGEIVKKLVITPSILISKAKVSKIANQEYTGLAVEPTFTVSMGKETLVGVAKVQYTAGMECDYYYEYQNNISAGKATIIITGCGKYGGEKKVTFNINGLPLKKATITGLSKSYTYTGSEIKPAITLNYIKNKGASAVALKGVAKEDYIEGVTVADYTYQFKNNVKKGTATILLTGVNNYSGTVKKTFKISAYDLAKSDGQKVEVFHESVVAYEKGGSKPAVIVKFNGRTLKEGRDYTVKYSNNTSAANTKKTPAISIIGKGNFGGKLVRNFTIVKKDISSLQLVPKDLVYKKKAGAYKVSFVITDTNGKTLKAGTDYDKKTVTYTYAVDTKLENGTVRLAGENIDKKDILPLGTVVKVTAQAKGNYVGSVYGYYRVVTSDIAKAKVTVKGYSYTGNQIELTKDDLKVVVGGVTLTKADYDIIGYTNNIKKGTATVTIRGKGNYGGTKTCKFKISSKDISK